MAKTAAKQVEDLTADAQKTLSQGAETLTKGIESATAFGQENVEAVVISSKIAAKAAESLSAEIAAYSKKAYEDSMAAAKELTGCKSVTEFVEKQSSYAKTSIETFVGEATKLNEMYAAAAKETLAPLNARFTAAVEAFKDYRV